MPGKEGEREDVGIYGRAGHGQVRRLAGYDAWCGLPLVRVCQQTGTRELRSIRERNVSPVVLETGGLL